MSKTRRGFEALRDTPRNVAASASGVVAIEMIGPTVVARPDGARYVVSMEAADVLVEKAGASFLKIRPTALSEYSHVRRIEETQNRAFAPDDYRHRMWASARMSPDSGLLSVEHAEEGTDAVIALHRLPGDTVWQRRYNPANGGSHIAAIAASWDGSVGAIVLNTDWRTPGGELVLFRLDTGDTQWTQPLALPSASSSVGAVVDRLVIFSDDGMRLAVLLADPDECRTCERIGVRSTADGTLLHSISIGKERPNLPRWNLGENTSVGFSADEIWFYFYTPRRSNGALGPLVLRTSGAGCSYEVYDVSKKKRVRTHEDATGGWKQALADCAIRSLHPLTGGRTLAIRIIDNDEVELLEFDGAP